MMHPTDPELLVSEIRAKHRELQQQAARDRLFRQACAATEPAEQQGGRKRERIHRLWVWLRLRPARTKARMA